MDFLPASFFDFVKLDCNREAFIQNTLKAQGIDSDIIAIGSSRHIYVHFPPASYDSSFKIKTVLVHYDRVKNSPGANDNSAAVFQVIQWAKRLVQSTIKHNIRLFFTDGEELGKTGIEEQGAFGIASRFKKLGIISDDVYVFDCCGRGDVLVVSQAGHLNSGSITFNKKLENLFQKTYELCRKASPQNWISLPVPYSDNAAFIACGIPAIALTILPRQEATDYLMNGTVPQTWELIHTMQDDISSLTKESFIIMSKVLDTLALQKTHL